MPVTTSFPRELSDADTLLWRIEADPVLRSPVIAVALLDREPEWAAVIDAFRRATDVLPRLAQRIERTPFSFGRLHWQADPSFAPEHHLRRIRVTHEGGVGAALEIAAIDATAAFDPARPPWQAVVVEGLGGGRAALVLRFHHSITDGVGGVELAEAIFDRQRRPRRVVARSRPPVEPPPRTAHPAARAGHVARGAVGAALDPIRTGRAAARTLASVGRILAPTPGAMSPLLVGRGIDRRLLVTVRPMAAIERAAEAVGGTVNDVFLAAVGGALPRLSRAPREARRRDPRHHAHQPPRTRRPAGREPVRSRSLRPAGGCARPRGTRTHRRRHRQALASRTVTGDR